jgi:1,6-anhydro-N-acetylmuramate kinase
MKRPAADADLIATATVLTAATIAHGRARGGAGDLIVSGGGVHNPQIMAHLAGFLPEAAISTSTDHGIDADAKEATDSAICWPWKRPFSMKISLVCMPATMTPAR